MFAAMHQTSQVHAQVGASSHCQCMRMQRQLPFTSAQRTIVRCASQKNSRKMLSPSAGPLLKVLQSAGTMLSAAAVSAALLTGGEAHTQHRESPPRNAALTLSFYGCSQLIGLLFRCACMQGACADFACISRRFAVYAVVCFLPLPLLDVLDISIHSSY